MKKGYQSLLAYLKARIKDFQCHRWESPVSGDWILFGMITVLGIVIGIVFMPDAVLNADMYEYYRQCLYPDLPRNAEHLGYIWILSGALKVFTGSGENSMNVLTSIFGGMSLGLVCIIAVRMTGDRGAALFAVMILAIHNLFLFNFLFPEIYIAQVFFLLLALSQGIGNRFFGAGLFLGIAFSISPSALLALPFFLLLQKGGRGFWIFVAGFLLFILVYLSINPAAIFSDRMLGAASQPFRPDRAMLITFHQFARGFLYFIPFLLLGLVKAWKLEWMPWFLISLPVLFFLQMFIGQIFYDVPVQLVTWCILSIFAGLGLKHFVRDGAKMPLWFFLSLGLPGVLELLSWSFESHPRMSLFTIFLGMGIAFGTALLLWVFRRSNTMRVLMPFIFGGIVFWHGTIEQLHWYHFAVDRKENIIEVGPEVIGNALVIGELENFQAYRHTHFAGKDQSNLVESRSLVFDENGEALFSGRGAFAAWDKVLLLDELLPVREELLQAGFEIDSLGTFEVAVRKN